VKKLIFLLSVLLLSSCVNKLTLSDIKHVKKCVITDVTIEEPRSTIEIGKRFIYETECGQHITANTNNLYHVGDTIVLIYRK
jgi:hypothetical protein